MLSMFLHSFQRIRLQPSSIFNILIFLHTVRNGRKGEIELNLLDLCGQAFLSMPKFGLCFQRRPCANWSI